ncbi:hypothetical protein CVT25_007703 [Psilocybe cyanescens]|uniref:C2 domain-containing protein n=1 Tax=Psilocybe cyanescens TaxID=93625 RepID=A0A409XVH5_PSICY|nr:hypothetical protein CVT25_007703 [Psilocybe cyanescens]
MDNDVNSSDAGSFLRTNTPNVTPTTTAPLASKFCSHPVTIWYLLSVPNNSTSNLRTLAPTRPNVQHPDRQNEMHLQNFHPRYTLSFLRFPPVFILSETTLDRAQDATTPARHLHSSLIWMDYARTPPQWARRRVRSVVVGRQAELAGLASRDLSRRVKNPRSAISQPASGVITRVERDECQRRFQRVICIWSGAGAGTDIGDPAATRISDRRRTPCERGGAGPATGYFSAIFSAITAMLMRSGISCQTCVGVEQEAIVRPDTGGTKLAGADNTHSKGKETPAMDPFIVITFGKKVFRPCVIRRSRNLVWDEKLLFHVRRYETSFKVQLSVLDWDNLSSNAHFGNIYFDVNEQVRHAPQPDKDAGLYPVGARSMRRGQRGCGSIVYR